MLLCTGFIYEVWLFAKPFLYLLFITLEFFTVVPTALVLRGADFPIFEFNRS
jgi:hypothetical protein